MEDNTELTAAFNAAEDWRNGDTYAQRRLRAALDSRSAFSERFLRDEDAANG